MSRINRKEVLIPTICPFCGKVTEIETNLNDFCEWQNGELAQDAFPYLSAGEREMLISGICLTCWGKMVEAEA